MTEPKPPKSLSSSPGLRQHWRPDRGWLTAVGPGQYCVSDSREILTTVLGSCIAACIWEPDARLGGLNHFLLPRGLDEKTRPSDALRYGAFAMETLVNEVLKHGGVRRNLKAKVFGGAHMLRGVKDMGRQNIDFVHQYLYDEGIRLVTEDVGGTRGRKIEFFPSTGRVRLKLLKEVERVPLVERESLYLKEISSQSVGGDIELF